MNMQKTIPKLKHKIKKAELTALLRRCRSAAGRGESGLWQKHQVALVRPTPAPEICSVKHWNLLPEPIAMSHQILTYTELRKQIHDDLRIQHPEWVEPNGECSMCDSYEARLIELLDTFTRTGSDESVADIHRVLEQGLN
jgi:hypothetical protein